MNIYEEVFNKVIGVVQRLLQQEINEKQALDEILYETDNGDLINAINDLKSKQQVIITIAPKELSVDLTGEGLTPTDLIKVFVDATNAVCEQTIRDLAKNGKNERDVRAKYSQYVKANFDAVAFNLTVTDDDVKRFNEEREKNEG